MTIKLEDFKICEVGIRDDIPIDEIKWLTGLKHLVEFDGRAFKEHAQLRDWCLENCTGKVVFIENMIRFNEIAIVAYFYNESDAVGFKLKWGE